MEPTGRDLLRMLKRCGPEELDLPMRTLVDLLDGPICADCRGRHLSVWEAIACSERADARLRRDARRYARRRGDTRVDASTFDPVEDLAGRIIERARAAAGD